METPNASKNSPKGWPKTPDGVTDWEYVFEAPDSGFIGVVLQAQSVATLNDCATVIINNLFTRKNDRPEVARFMALLEPVIEEGERTKDIDAARDQVIHLLRQIKTERVEKAETYVREKRRKQAIERRGEKAATATPRNNRRIAIAAACVMVILIGGIGGFVFWTTGDAPDTAKRPAKTDAPSTDRTTEKQKPARKQAREKPEPGKPESNPTLTYPQAVLLKPVVRGIKTARGDTRYVFYQPFLEVNDAAAYRKICTNQPWVTDAIFSHLDRDHPKKRRASGAELAKISSAALRRINDRYGENTVSGMLLINNSSRRFQGTVQGCQFEFGMPK